MPEESGRYWSAINVVSFTTVAVLSLVTVGELWFARLSVQNLESRRPEIKKEKVENQVIYSLYDEMKEQLLQLFIENKNKRIKIIINRAIIFLAINILIVISQAALQINIYYNYFRSNLPEDLLAILIDYKKEWNEKGLSNLEISQKTEDYIYDVFIAHLKIKFDNLWINESKIE